MSDGNWFDAPLGGEDAKPGGAPSGGNWFDAPVQATPAPAPALPPSESPGALDAVGDYFAPVGQSLQRIGQRYGEKRAAADAAWDAKRERRPLTGPGDVLHTLLSRGPFSGKTYGKALDAADSGLEWASRGIGYLMDAPMAVLEQAGGEAESGVRQAGVPDAINPVTGTKKVLGGAMETLGRVPQAASNDLQRIGVRERTADNLGEFALDAMQLMAPAIPAGARRLAKVRRVAPGVDDIPLRAQTPADVLAREAMAPPARVPKPAAIDDVTPRVTPPDPFKLPDETTRRLRRYADNEADRLADEAIGARNDKVPFYEDAAGGKVIEDVPPPRQLRRIDEPAPVAETSPTPLRAADPPAMNEGTKLRGGLGTTLRRRGGGQSGEAINPALIVEPTTAAQHATARKQGTFAAPMARLEDARQAYRSAAAAGRDKAKAFLEKRMPRLGQLKHWLLDRTGYGKGAEFEDAFRRWRGASGARQYDAAKVSKRVREQLDNLGEADEIALRDYLDARGRDVELPDHLREIADSPEIQGARDEIAANQERLVELGGLSDETSQRTSGEFLTRKVARVNDGSGRPRTQRQPLADDVPSVQIDTSKLTDTDTLGDLAEHARTFHPKASFVTGKDGVAVAKFGTAEARDQFMDSLRAQGVGERAFGKVSDGLTAAEREAFGQSLGNVRQGIAETILDQRRQIAALEFFEVIDGAQQNGKRLVAPEPPDNVRTDRWAGKRGREYEVGEIDGFEYVKVPDEGFGKIGGKWLRKDAYEDVIDAFVYSKPGTVGRHFDATMRAWKGSKTLMSLRTHARQWYSLMQLSGMAGVSVLNPMNVRYWDDAFRHVIKQDGPMYRELLEQNVLQGGDYIAAELAELLDKTKNLSGTERIAAIVGNPLEVIPGIDKAKRGLSRVYNVPDQTLRVAAYLKARSRGFSPDEAGRYVDKFTPTFSQGSRLTEGMSRYASPFWRFKSEMIRISGNVMMEHPARMAHAAIFSRTVKWATALGAGAGLWDALSDDEEDAITESMGAGFQPAPGRNDEGMAHAVDMRYIDALGDFTTPPPDALGETEIGTWALQAAGLDINPIVEAAVAYRSDRDAFTGNRLTSVADRSTLGGKALSLAGKHLEATAPGLTPGIGRDARKIEDAIFDVPAKPWKSKQSVATAIADAIFGLVIRPLDEKVLKTKDAMTMRRLVREGKADIRRGDETKEDTVDALREAASEFGERKGRLERVKRKRLRRMDNQD